MTQYSYTDCLQNSYRVNWKLSDVVDGGRFEPTRRWLPAELSGADHVASLSPADQLKLTHVEMGAYTHLFGYVEEFIAPKMVALARDFEIDTREAFDALTNFAAEEVKHMTLFRELRGRIDNAMGFPLALLPNEKAVARAVLSKHTGAVLLLTAAIEWLTQRHYLTCFRGNDALDPFTRHIFKCHWLEESQHARLDELETLRAFAHMPEADKDVAIDDLIELVGAVDGLLQQQAEYDVENFERYRDRALEPATRRDVHDRVLDAKRYTFIETGVTHPNFMSLFKTVTTPAQQARVQEALAGLLHPVAA
jgi:hypothetical protein